MTVDHKILYDTEIISRDYASRDYLDPAERTVLELLRPDLPYMDMLDMGVGGGRTTKYFAPVVKNYTGADYASTMIDVCLEKYGNDYFFLCCDARDMKEIPDDSYDLILFSYNGIDSFRHHERMASLKEIHRILKPGGYFCFSSHNLEWEGLPGIFTIDYRTGIPGISDLMGPLIRFRYRIRTAWKVIRLSLLNRSLNMSRHIRRLRKKKRGHIYDNSLNGKAKVYYVSPDEQVRQLEDSGFSRISTISRNGQLTEDPLIINRGGWVYYLCQAEK